MTLAGVWKLKSFKISNSDQDLSDWGMNLQGLLIFTSDHYVSVSINRHSNSDDNSSLEDCLFYAGTYEVAGSEILHFVTVATDRSKIGKVLRRNFLLDEDNLILTGTARSGKRFELKWNKSV